MRRIARLLAGMVGMPLPSCTCWKFLNPYCPKHGRQKAG